MTPAVSGGELLAHPRWNKDAEIQALLKTKEVDDLQSLLAKYSAAGRDALLGRSFDRTKISAAGLSYERLDQLTMEVLLGVR